jgi:hypothetical protein
MSSWYLATLLSAAIMQHCDQLISCSTEISLYPAALWSVDFLQYCDQLIPVSCSFVITLLQQLRLFPTYVMRDAWPQHKADGIYPLTDIEFFLHSRWIFPTSSYIYVENLQLWHIPYNTFQRQRRNFPMFFLHSSVCRWYLAALLISCLYLPALQSADILQDCDQMISCSILISCYLPALQPTDNLQHYDQLLSSSIVISWYSAGLWSDAMQYDRLISCSMWSADTVQHCI